MKLRPLFLLSLVFACCLCIPGAAQQVNIEINTLSLFDSARNRPVPLCIYAPLKEGKGKLKPALISHGYGGKNNEYGFIAAYLATHGYYVVSIQQDLPEDAPMPNTGKPYEVRMPFWKRGAESILFTLNELKKTKPSLDYQHLLLVGHSNGGDMSMLFAKDYPGLAAAIISLDNRRMPFLRADRPRVLSLRSSDQPADSGVIPTPAEQARYRMKVVKLPATIHNDMWDGATEAQKAEMLRYIGAFLRTL